jgi:uncharacterized protein involved in cysteine biosynthesis
MGFGGGLKATSGVASLWRGFRFLAQDRAARRLAYVPGLVALVLWTLALYLGVHYVPELAGHFFPGLLELGRGWTLLIDVLVLLLLAPVALLVAMLLTPILCAPVLERLVLLRERALGIAPRPAAGLLRELRCALSSQLGWLVVFGPLLALLWLAALLAPAAVPVLSVVQFLVGGAWLALSLLDYPLSLRGVGFRARLVMFRRGFSAVFGFGAACALLFAIPLFGLWGLPVAVVAAAELAAQLEA